MNNFDKAIRRELRFVAFDRTMNHVGLVRHVPEYRFVEPLLSLLHNAAAEGCAWPASTFSAAIAWRLRKTETANSVA